MHRKTARSSSARCSRWRSVGCSIAAIQGVAPAINIPAGAVTCYMVVTALTTVRPFGGWSKRLATAGLVYALSR